MVDEKSMVIRANKRNFLSNEFCMLTVEECLNNYVERDVSMAVKPLFSLAVLFLN